MSYVEFFFTVALSHALTVTNLETCRIQNLFGSDANNSCHSQLISQTSICNDAKKIGLLYGIGTLSATKFYGIHHALYFTPSTST